MKSRGIGDELRALSKLIMRRAENDTHIKDIESMTGTNGWIIAFLANNRHRDVYQRDIEKEFCVTRSTASKVIKLMEQKGYVRRESVPHDARLKKLTLTEKAEEISDMMLEDHRMMEQMLLKGFEPEEIEILTGYILRLKGNVL